MIDDVELQRIRHSLAHALAAAVTTLWPTAKLAIGPATEDGFYYDVELDRPLSKKNLDAIQQKMDDILRTWQGFTHRVVTEKEAREKFKNNSYKTELIEDIVKRGEDITVYTAGDFEDLCRGGHVSNPSKDIQSHSWKLDRIAGAYWRGDEKNNMLTRIYGLAFASKKDLEAYEKKREEATNRDHRSIGAALDLFIFSELVGAGLPLWTPKGTLVRDLLDQFVWELRMGHGGRRGGGYQRVDIPHLAKKELFEQSGHWQKFRDDLFVINTRERHTFVVKPMNCPHHIEIFRRKLWSYRELPVRYASTTKVYRDEQSGELSGLTRVRCITQDDAHIFCRREHLREEVDQVWSIIDDFYRTFNLPVEPRLSFHDPSFQEKYLGVPEQWREAERALEDIAEARLGKAGIVKDSGEASFYGPKIDFIAKDSLGREWQEATIQLDMNLPERFDLTCINERGKKERILIIHAAVMGSIERFVAILIEHYAGAFPLWLSPVHIKVLPIGEKFLESAQTVTDALKKDGIRAELDDADETLGKKVRRLRLEKVPYWAVIGEKEMSGHVVTLESRDRGTADTVSTEEVSRRLKWEILHRGYAP